MKRAMLFLILTQLGRRKGQYLLLGSSMLLGACLMSLGISTMSGLYQPFEKVFAELKGSHLLLYFHQQTENPDQILEWFSQQAEVAQTGLPQAWIMQNGPFYHQAHKIEQRLRLTEFSFQSGQTDQLKLVKGYEQEEPGPGQIWISLYLAKQHQIAIGDTLSIPDGSGLWRLEVSGWVVDPHYASGMVNPGIAWVGPGSLSFAYPLSELQQLSIGIRLQQPELIPAVWDRFIAETAYQGDKLDYALFHTAFGSVSGLLASVLLLVSLMAFALALLLIRNSLKANIQADFRQIGILKSLGYRPRDISQSYLGQILLIGIPAILIGVTAGRALLPFLLQNSLRNLALQQSGPVAGPVLISALSSFCLVAMIAWWGSRKASKVPAAQAIRSGEAASTHKKVLFQLSVFSRAQLTFLMGLMRHRPLRSLSLMVGIALSSGIIMMLLNIGYSFSGLERQPEKWGFEAAELNLQKASQTLISRKHDEWMGLFRQHPEIKYILPYQWMSLSVLPQANQSGRELNGKVYSLNPSLAGLENLEGVHPQAAQEISLCIGTARQYGLQVGDSLFVQLEGQRSHLRVSGIYQDIGNMGQGFRLHSSAVKTYNPLFEPAFYALGLQAGTDKDNFKSLLQQQYGEMIQFERSIGEIVEDMGIMQAVWGLVQLVAFFFSIVMLIMILFDSGLLFREEKTQFQTLRSIGFQASQLRGALFLRTLFLLALGLIVGFLISQLAGGPLMNLLMGGLGLPAFPYQSNMFQIIIAAITLSALGLGLSSWRIYSQSLFS